MGLSGVLGLSKSDPLAQVETAGTDPFPACIPAALTIFRFVSLSKATK